MRTIYQSNIPTYFDWLKGQVEYFNQAGQHEQLFHKLHDMVYYPVLELDRNREKDGISLRDTYLAEFGGYMDESIVVDSPCSVFEFLVALANRMNYIYAHENENCTAMLFWEIMDNIGLKDGWFRDVEWNCEREEIVDTAIGTLLSRRFELDGRGGLFPMPPSFVGEDQTNVEIWYQMNRYLINKMREEGR